MSRKVRRVPYHLDTRDVKDLPLEEITAILRGADDLIMSGGRSLLAKILKGSRDKKLLSLELDKSPVYGYCKHLTLADIQARVDWIIVHNYLDINYDHRLPLLRYTESGWEIERETYARELMEGFDDLLASGQTEFDMSYLKDRARDMILILLDMVEASRDARYIPILEAWAEVDYKKVRKRIGEVIEQIEGGR
jgi:superfamily II DNA helicase RecQ